MLYDDILTFASKKVKLGYLSVELFLPHCNCYHTWPIFKETNLDFVSIWEVTVQHLSEANSQLHQFCVTLTCYNDRNPAVTLTIKETLL